MAREPVIIYKTKNKNVDGYPKVDFRRLLSYIVLGDMADWCSNNFDEYTFLIYFDSAFFTDEEQVTLFRLMFLEFCK